MTLLGQAILEMQCAAQNVQEAYIPISHYFFLTKSIAKKLHPWYIVQNAFIVEEIYYTFALKT